MTSPFTTYAVDGRIATVTLNRPQTRNAIADRADCEDLVAALRRADADPAVSVLILAAEGEGFCSGGDLRGIRERNGIGPLATPADTRDNYKRGVAQIALAFAEIEVATVAAVQGHAIGLGCDLAAFCDLRVAADDAQFASSFVKVGHHAGRRRRLDLAAGRRLSSRSRDDPDRRSGRRGAGAGHGTGQHGCRA